jgi:acyl dehydratase
MSAQSNPRPPFEALAEGTSLPELSRGPLTSVHLFRWSAAIENLHRIHYDLPFAIGHDRLPGLLVNGSWKQHFLVQMLRGWLEPDGWLRRVSFQFRGMDVIGATLTAYGTITGLSERDGFGQIEIEVGIRNQDGERNTIGSARAVVPLAGGPPVPYPFPSL